MKFVIKHEIKGRIRIHICGFQRMNPDMADELQYYLSSQENIVSVKIYDRTQDFVICYRGKRENILKIISSYQKGMIQVPVLDGTAIGVSVLRGDMNTAASIMFLLGIGETLEEWTHKKSVDDLAKSMSLNVTKVWKIEEDLEVLVSSNEIHSGDQICYCQKSGC